MNQVHKLSLVLLAVLGFSLSACSKTTDLEKKAEHVRQKLAGGAYPHSPEFKLTRLHGAHYLQNKTSCQVCHKTGIEASNPVAGASSCLNCHHFPNPEWLKGSVHGAEFFKDRQACLSCHDRKTRDATAATQKCTTCHEFPHTPGFAAPANHGKRYIEGQDYSEPVKKHMCRHCHDNPEAKAVKEFAMSCGTCHVKIPHEEGWVEEGKHAGVAKTFAGKCLNCHTDHKKNLPIFGDCRACHEGEQMQIEMKSSPEVAQTGKKTSSNKAKRSIFDVTKSLLENRKFIKRKEAAESTK